MSNLFLPYLFLTYFYFIKNIIKFTFYSVIIHWLYPLILLQGRGGLGSIPANMRWGWGTPWTSRQFITGLTYKNKHPFSVTFTPTGNLELTQSWNPSAAFAVWLPVDSDTASGGKPHYSWAAPEGGEYPFLTSFSAWRSLGSSCCLFRLASLHTVNS